MERIVSQKSPHARHPPPKMIQEEEDLAAARGITNSILISIIGWTIIALVVIALWPLRPWQ